MASQGEPRKDAHSLRLQIEAMIRVVAALMSHDPNFILADDVKGMIYAIFSLIQEQYGSRLIPDIEVWKTVWEQSGGPTAQGMRTLLETTRASLEAEEGFEARQEFYDDAASTAPSPWGSAAQHFEHPPEDLEIWPDDEDGREYRIGPGSQHRRTSGNRSRQRRA